MICLIGGFFFCIEDIQRSICWAIIEIVVSLYIIAIYY